MKTNKKSAIILIVAILIITGIVFAGKLSGLRQKPDSAVKAPVADDQAAKKQAANDEEVIVIPASYVNATGTVTSIDAAKKMLTIKTDAGKTLRVAYGEATTIYQMNNNIPENKADTDITKNADISVQYDSTNNMATSIMLGGKWKKF